MEKPRSMTPRQKPYSEPSRATLIEYLPLPLLMVYSLPDPETPKSSAMMSGLLIMLSSNSKGTGGKSVGSSMMPVDWLLVVMIT